MTQVSAPPCSLRFPRVCGSFASSMAIVTNALEKVDALKAGGADLVFLFDKKLVDEDTQAKFFHIGVTTVEQLAVTAKDQADLEEVLKVNFELDPKDLPSRIRAGGLSSRGCQPRPGPRNRPTSTGNASRGRSRRTSGPPM